MTNVLKDTLLGCMRAAAKTGDMDEAVIVMAAGRAIAELIQEITDDSGEPVDVLFPGGKIIATSDDVMVKLIVKERQV